MPLPAVVASHPALTFTTTVLAEIMTACFDGYVVPQAISGLAPSSCRSALAERQMVPVKDRSDPSPGLFISRIATPRCGLDQL